MTEYGIIKKLDNFEDLLNKNNVDSILAKISNWSYQNGLSTEFKNAMIKESGTNNNVQKLQFIINDLEETISQNVFLA